VLEVFEQMNGVRCPVSGTELDSTRSSLGNVGSRAIVVDQLKKEQVAQVPLAKDDDMVIPINHSVFSSCQRSWRPSISVGDII
jgi:hypothetical protein